MKEIKSLPVKRQASVSGILKKLGVSRSGYNAWKKRVPSDTSVRRAVLKEKIQKIYEESHPAHPDAVWCSDITYIGTFEGFVYLTSVMDLYSRKIISWVLSETLEASHVVEFLGFFLGRARPFQVYRKLKIDFPLSFHIFLNVRKALFYQLYGHFSFRLILPNRHVLSRFFMVNRGKYRGKTLGYHAP